MNKFFKISLALVLSSSSLFAQTKTDYKFAFGSGKKAKGYTKVLPSDAYSAAKGYGFDFDSKVVEGDRGGKDKVKGDLIKSDKPFYFSVAVPEGNYKITVTIGDSKESSESTVKAESRRLMLENVKTAAGKYVTKTFIVNVK
ncbi:MAG: rhamnogalacturonan acetylesterase, partial [Pedobacter sp.]